jgi:hypothetical protein
VIHGEIVVQASGIRHQQQAEPSSLTA